MTIRRSRRAHPSRLAFPIHYVHDPSNGGLATAYNFALARAESEDREWLLLLDQDTSLTREFIVELLETARTPAYAARQVAAIVPKLLVNGKVYSPAIPFIDQMRRQFLPSQTSPRLPMSSEFSRGPCMPITPASTLSVSALRSIGGFPVEFWLDFLDHAVFHALMLKWLSIVRDACHRWRTIHRTPTSPACPYGACTMSSWPRLCM